MDHDEEVMLAVLDEEFTASLDRDYEADLERSVDIDLHRWRRRTVLQRVGEAAVKPIRRFL
jgi:cardiolipin synthase